MIKYEVIKDVSKTLFKEELKNVRRIMARANLNKEINISKLENIENMSVSKNRKSISYRPKNNRLVITIYPSGITIITEARNEEQIKEALGQLEKII